MIQGREMVGDLSCGRMVGPNNETCGQPGVGHFLWAHEGDNGVACVDHTAWAMTQAVDYHPIGPDCTMPGAEWVYSTPDGAGCCLWPMLPDEVVEIELQDMADA